MNAAFLDRGWFVSLKSSDQDFVLLVRRSQYIEGCFGDRIALHGPQDACDLQSTVGAYEHSVVSLKRPACLADMDMPQGTDAKKKRTQVAIVP